MKPLLLGLGAFVVALVAHLLVRRLRPAGHYGGLLGACAAVPLAALAVFALAAGHPAGAALVPRTPVESVSFLILYGALALAWATTYPPIQADSPTMSLVLRIDAAGPPGLDPRELEAEFTDARLILPRLADLVAGGLVRQVDGRYVVAPRGALLARTYLGYRRLLRMEKGG